jgi:hypothetical protein
MQNVQEPLVTIRQLNYNKGRGMSYTAMFPAYIESLSPKTKGTGMSFAASYLTKEIDNELQRLGYYHDPTHPTLICTAPVRI